MASEFKLPELGENILSGTITGVLVPEGETFVKDQVLLEIETDKAVIELPAESGGVVREMMVKEGDEVKIGQVLFRYDEAGTAPAVVSSAEPAGEKQEKPALETVPVKQEAPEPSKPRTSEVEHYPAPVQSTPQKPPSEVAPAAPSVRRFAREIGIDINQVPGTGPGGRISVDDVKNYSKVLNRQHAAQSTVLQGFDAEPLPDFSRWGNIDVQSMGNVRQKTATHLSYAWATVPQVTQFEKADITELEKLRKKYAPRAEAAGGKLTMTAILLKVCEAALKLFPQFNSSIDMRNKQVIYKQYYNIGVAVDTDRGLLVPVIKDIDRKNIIRISVELNQMAEKARTKKLSLDEMQGGNFSISNLGGIGGTAFTPIVNTPEVAILGVSRGKIEPVYIDGSFQPRMMLPLSLTYDHRIIDGADGIRFLRWVVEALENPFLLPLEG